MRIAKIIGSVTLNQAHPLLRGGALRLAVPQSLANLLGRSEAEAETLVVYDTLAAGDGDLIMMTEGAEAAQPFYPQTRPIDAYNSGILDQIELDERLG
jgi:microcompartment protein CcmK/EutM